MKKIILSFVVGLLAVAAFGQGSVTFQNASSIPGWSPVADRNVKFGPNSALWHPSLVPGDNVSSNYAGLDLSGLRVALYYAPGFVADSYQPPPDIRYLAGSSSGGSPYATFRRSTVSSAGAWFGGTRYLNGVAPQGGIASLMVVVWDSRVDADPLSWISRSYGLWGRSSVFQYTTPLSDTPVPADFLMNNLTSFTIDVSGFHWVPEPTATTLTGLGAVMLFLFRKHRQP